MKEVTFISIFLLTLCFELKAEECTSVYNDYFEWKLLTFPTWANKMGFHKYNDKIENYAAGAFEEHRVKIEALKTSASSCSYDTTNQTQAHHKTLFEREMQGFLDGYELKFFYLAPVNLMDNQPKNLARVFGEPNHLLWRNEEDMLNNFKKLQKVPKLLQECMNLLILGQGEQEGVKYNFAAFHGIEEMYKPLLKPVDDSPFFAQFLKNYDIAPHIADNARMFITEEVITGLQSLKTYLINYRDKVAFQNPGMETTGTTTHYLERLKWHSTLHISDTEQLYTDSLAAFNKQLADFKIKHPDYFTATETDTPAKLFKHYSSMSDQSFETKEECQRLLKYLTEMFIPPNLAKIMFYESDYPKPNTLKIDCTETGAPVYYFAAGGEGRPATSFYNYKIIKKFEAYTLSLHEGLAGHHLQDVFTRTHGFPDFMKYTFYNSWSSSAPSRLQVYNGFLEGWAMYAETLFYEQNYYDSVGPAEKKKDAIVGYYKGSLLRTARIFLDIGLNTGKYTFKQAAGILMSNLGLSLPAALSEVGRYIIWPGQAASYKLGENEIMRVRTLLGVSTEENYKKFHNSALSCVGELKYFETCVTKLYNQASE